MIDGTDTFAKCADIMRRAIASLIRKGSKRRIGRIKRARDNDQVVRKRVIGNLRERIGVDRGLRIIDALIARRDDDDRPR